MLKYIRKSIFELIIFNIIFFQNLLLSNYAICSKPILNLTGSYFSDSKNIIQKFNTLPISQYPATFGPSRIGQLLFSEIVEILETKDDQAKIRVIQKPYHNLSGKKFETFCTDLSGLKQILDFEIDERLKIPFLKKDQKIVQLILPFFDEKNSLTFSIGTSFVVRNFYENGVIAITPFKDIEDFFIPKNKYLILKKIDQINKRDRFLNLLKLWSSDGNGKIPYVIGGQSATNFIQNGFAKESLERGICRWKPIEKYKNIGGFDCSRLIFCAAQLAQINLPGINSSSLIIGLEKRKNAKEVENGDIIYICGHVMIIFDKDEGFLIEARSYKHGYGCVQKIPFYEQFKDVKNIDDFFKLKKKKQPLQRLNKNQKIVEIINNFEILKLI